MSCTLVFQTVCCEHWLALLTPSFWKVSGFPWTYKALVQLRAVLFLFILSGSGSIRLWSDSRSIIKHKKESDGNSFCILLLSHPLGGWCHIYHHVFSGFWVPGTWLSPRWVQAHFILTPSGDHRLLLEFLVLRWENWAQETSSLPSVIIYLDTKISSTWLLTKALNYHLSQQSSLDFSDSWPWHASGAFLVFMIFWMSGLACLLQLFLVMALQLPEPGPDVSL